MIVHFFLKVKCVKDILSDVVDGDSSTTPKWNNVIRVVGLPIATSLPDTGMLCMLYLNSQIRGEKDHSFGWMKV